MIVCDKCGNELPINIIGDSSYIQCNFCGDFIMVDLYRDTYDDKEARN